MALTLPEVQRILHHRAYKPGWKITAYRGQTTMAVMVNVNGLVEDSYHPGTGVELDVNSPVPGFALEDELAFDKWLSWRLQQLEVHESQEWYRKPGRDLPMVPVFNPHRDGADRDVWPVRRHEHQRGMPYTDAWSQP